MTRRLSPQLIEAFDQIFEIARKMSSDPASPEIREQAWAQLKAGLANDGITYQEAAGIYTEQQIRRATRNGH